MKSEPSVFSIDDLKRKGEAPWDGVRNYQVRNYFRDEMKKGDLAVFYNSSCADVGVVGEMEILNPAQVDVTQFQSTHRYYDPKSNKEEPRWLAPQVKFKAIYKKLVSLEQIKKSSQFTNSRLTQKGNRLSVIELTKEQFVWLKEQGK